MIHHWHSNGANMSINGLFPGFQNILCCLFSANRRVRSRLNWLEDDVFILILSKHHLHHPQELLLITIRGYLNELNRSWVTGWWLSNQGNIGINCPGWAHLIKCRGGQLCDWAGRGKCDTPVMISPPLSRCHAVSRITWHEREDDTICMWRVANQRTSWHPDFRSPEDDSVRNIQRESGL